MHASLVRRLATAVSFWLCFVSLAAAHDAPQTIDVQGLAVSVWMPKTQSGSPVILFSHGFHGCATQSAFLMEALVDAGYAVFAPDHKDAACEGGAISWFDPPAVPFTQEDKWTDATYRDRSDDLKRLMDVLPADTRFDKLDWKHIGLAGHSLGGYTVLGLAGGWPRWKDGRIKAVLALSPYTAPFILRRTLGNIAVPVMYQAGTLDAGIRPNDIEISNAYAQTPPPRYFVEFDGAGHFAWTDLNAVYHDIIADYSVAFFDAELKGKAFPKALKAKQSEVYDLKLEAEMQGPFLPNPSEKFKQQ